MNSPVRNRHLKSRSSIWLGRAILRNGAWVPRGTVLCLAQTTAGAAPPSLKSLLSRADWASVPADAVLFEGDSDALHAVNQAVAARPGPLVLVPVQGVTRDDLTDGRAGYAWNGCCWSGRSATTPRRPAAMPA
jgi:hypothetical protein